MRVITALAAAMVLTACRPVSGQTEYAPWAVDSQRDQIRDINLVTGTIWSNEVHPQSGQPSDGRPVLSLTVTYGPHGVSGTLGGELWRCSPSQPVVFRFDDEEPSEFVCMPDMLGGGRSVVTQQYLDGFAAAKRLIIEHYDYSERATQNTFDVEGFWSAFTQAKADGSSTVGSRPVARANLAPGSAQEP